MIILNRAVDMHVGAISPTNKAFQTSLGTNISEDLNDIIFTAKYVGIFGLAMFLGWIIYLIITRFPPVKTIF